MSGFFGKMLGEFEGAQDAPAGTGNLVSALVSQAGGVSGLMDKFGEAGLTEHVQSWVGNGSNLSVAAADIEQVFPPEQLEALAEKHGIPRGMVSQLLASVLPQAVNAATPDGAAPAAPADDSQN